MKLLLPGTSAVAVLVTVTAVRAASLYTLGAHNSIVQPAAQLEARMDLDPLGEIFNHAKVTELSQEVKGGSPDPASILNSLNHIQAPPTREGALETSTSTVQPAKKRRVPKNQGGGKEVTRSDDKNLYSNRGAGKRKIERMLEKATNPSNRKRRFDYDPDASDDTITTMAPDDHIRHMRGLVRKLNKYRQGSPEYEQLDERIKRLTQARNEFRASRQSQDPATSEQLSGSPGIENGQMSVSDELIMSMSLADFGKDLNRLRSRIYTAKEPEKAALGRHLDYLMARRAQLEKAAKLHIIPRSRPAKASKASSRSRAPRADHSAREERTPSSSSSTQGGPPTSNSSSHGDWFTDLDMDDDYWTLGKL